MTHTTVDTFLTDSHFSGCIKMDRMGFYGTEDIWVFNGAWYFHSTGWNIYVGGSVRGQYANQQLSKIRIVNDSTVLDNQKWEGAVNIDYW